VANYSNQSTIKEVERYEENLSILKVDKPNRRKLSKKKFKRVDER